MPLRMLNDDVRLMHKLMNGKLMPTEKTRFLRMKMGCRDSLMVTGIIPLIAVWLVGMQDTLKQCILDE